MILRFERQEYWDWIEISLHFLCHPLQERFKGYDPHRVLVSRDELDLIIEAVTECRDDWEWSLDQEEGKTKKELQGLESDIEMLNETIDFLKELLVTP
jgi:virulence-associated protein VagC